MSHPLVEEETTHRVVLKDGSKELREIILLGLRAKGIKIPDDASILIEKESGWEDSKNVIRVVW